MPRRPRGREPVELLAARAALARATRTHNDNPTASTERALAAAEEEYTAARAEHLLASTLGDRHLGPASTGRLVGAVLAHAGAA